MDVPQVTDRLLRLPATQAARYARPHSELFDELVSAGNLHLVQALGTYDPAHGAAVETHAFRRVSLGVRKAYRRLGERPLGVVLSMDHPWERKGYKHGAVFGDFVPDPHDRVAAADARDAVAAALAALPADWREVFVLHASDGHTFREVAARVGRDRSVVQRQFVRAKAAVREAARHAARESSPPPEAVPMTLPPAGSRWTHCLRGPGTVLCVSRCARTEHLAVVVRHDTGECRHYALAAFNGSVTNEVQTDDGRTTTATIPRFRPLADAGGYADAPGTGSPVEPVVGKIAGHKSTGSGV